MSCTTLRSGGFIGSSARSRFVVANLLGDLAGEGGQRLPPALPVPADVDPEASAATTEAVLHHRAHELLDRLERRAPRADEQAETLTVDRDQHRVVVDPGSSPTP